jgi:hypothetical protein
VIIWKTQNQLKKINQFIRPVRNVEKSFMMGGLVVDLGMILVEIVKCPSCKAPINPNKEYCWKCWYKIIEKFNGGKQNGM